MTNRIDKSPSNNTDLSVVEQRPTQPIQNDLWWVISAKLAGVRKPVAGR